MSENPKIKSEDTEIPASEDKKMPTCGVSHTANSCGGLCDRRENHPDADHHCNLCGAWF